MKTSIQKVNVKFIFIIFLFLFAFLERTIWDLGANIELLTSALILSTYFLNSKKTFWLVLLTIALSDLIIGNTNIFLFTWSGFLIPAFFSGFVIKKLIINHKSRITKKIFGASALMLTGLSTNIFFYIWTNFGVWLLDTWGMYSNDFAGLIRCYINALPFLKNQFLSSIIFIPMGFFAIEILLKYLPDKIKLVNRSFMTNH